MGTIIARRSVSRVTNNTPNENALVLMDPLTPRKILPARANANKENKEENKDSNAISSQHKPKDDRQSRFQGAGKFGFYGRDLEGNVNTENNAKLRAKYEDVLDDKLMCYFKKDKEATLLNNIIFDIFLLVCRDLENPNSHLNKEKITAKLRTALGIQKDSDKTSIQAGLTPAMMVLIFTLRGECYQAGFLGLPKEPETAQKMFEIAYEIKRQTVPGSQPAENTDAKLNKLVKTMLRKAKPKKELQVQTLQTLSVIVRAHRLTSDRNIHEKEDKLAEAGKKALKTSNKKPNTLHLPTLKFIAAELSQTEELTKERLDGIRYKVVTLNEDIYDVSTLHEIVTIMRRRKLDKLDHDLLSEIAEQVQCDATTIELLRTHITSKGPQDIADLAKLKFPQKIKLDEPTIKYLKKLLSERLVDGSEETPLNRAELNILIKETEGYQRAVANRDLPQDIDVLEFFANHAAAKIGLQQNQAKVKANAQSKHINYFLRRPDNDVLPEQKEQTIPEQKEQAPEAQSSDTNIHELISLIRFPKQDIIQSELALKKLIRTFHEVASSEDEDAAIKKTKLQRIIIKNLVKELEARYTQAERQFDLVRVTYVIGSLYNAMSLYETDEESAKKDSFTENAALWMERCHVLQELITHPEKWDITDVEQESSKIASENVPHSVLLRREMTARLLKTNNLMHKQPLAALAYTVTSADDLKRTNNRKNNADPIEKWDSDDQYLGDPKRFVADLGNIRDVALLTFSLPDDTLDTVYGLMGEEYARFIGFLTSKSIPYDHSKPDIKPEKPGDQPKSHLEVLYDEHYESYRPILEQAKTAFVERNFSHLTEDERQEKIKYSLGSEREKIMARNKQFKDAVVPFGEFIKFIRAKQGNDYSHSPERLNSLLNDFFESKENDLEGEKKEQQHSENIRVRPLIIKLFENLVEKNQKLLTIEVLKSPQLDLHDQTFSFLHRIILNIPDGKGVSVHALQTLLNTVRDGTEKLESELAYFRACIKYAQEAQTVSQILTAPPKPAVLPEKKETGVRMLTRALTTFFIRKQNKEQGDPTQNSVKRAATEFTPSKSAKKEYKPLRRSSTHNKAINKTSISAAAVEAEEKQTILVAATPPVAAALNPAEEPPITRNRAHAVCVQPEQQQQQQLPQPGSSENKQQLDENKEVKENKEVTEDKNLEVKEKAVVIQSLPLPLLSPKKPEIMTGRKGGAIFEKDETSGRYTINREVFTRAIQDIIATPFSNNRAKKAFNKLMEGFEMVGGSDYQAKFSPSEKTQIIKYLFIVQEKHLGIIASQRPGIKETEGMLLQKSFSYHVIGTLLQKGIIKSNDGVKTAPALLAEAQRLQNLSKARAAKPIQTTHTPLLLIRSDNTVIMSPTESRKVNPEEFILQELLVRQTKKVPSDIRCDVENDYFGSENKECKTSQITRFTWQKREQQARSTRNEKNIPHL